MAPLDLATTLSVCPRLRAMRCPAVWDKIKKDKHVAEFKNDQDEEFEDSNGNVMSRKTYEDMRRQGLL